MCQVIYKCGGIYTNIGMRLYKYLWLFINVGDDLQMYQGIYKYLQSLC